MKILHIPTGALCIITKKEKFSEMGHKFAIHILENIQYRNEIDNCEQKYKYIDWPFVWEIDEQYWNICKTATVLCCKLNQQEIEFNFDEFELI